MKASELFFRGFKKLFFESEPLCCSHMKNHSHAKVKFVTRFKEKDKTNCNDLNYARVKVSTIRIIYCIIEKQKNNVPCGI